MITSIIVHYNRPGNIIPMVESIRKQSINSKIWIWDNSGNCPECNADAIIKSNFNFYQNPRYALLHMVETDYIWLQDDDRKIKDADFFEKLIEESNKHMDCLLGCNGKTFKGDDIDPEKPYQHNTGWVGYESETDMVNAGFCFFHRNIINEMSINPYDELTKEEFEHGDDIFSSSKVKTRVSETIKNGMDVLDECGLKLSGKTEHMNIRNKLCKRFWL